jgi:hypothetical protein
MTKIIAFSAYAGTGKDTTATELYKQLTADHYTELYSMSEPGKAAVANTLQVPLEALEDKEWRKSYTIVGTKSIDSCALGGDHLTPIDLVRVILESVATSGYPYLWAQLTLNRILRDKPDYAIVTDLRRTRELSVLSKHPHFYHFHLDRGVALTRTHEHVSESEISVLKQKALKAYDLSQDIRSIITDMLYIVQ